MDATWTKSAIEWLRWFEAHVLPGELERIWREVGANTCAGDVSSMVSDQTVAEAVTRELAFRWGVVITHDVWYTYRLERGWVSRSRVTGSKEQTLVVHDLCPTCGTALSVTMRMTCALEEVRVERASVNVLTDEPCVGGGTSSVPRRDGTAFAHE